MATKRTGPTLLQRARRTPAIVKATAHQETGVGTSKVKRQFFGLSPTDEQFLTDELSALIDRNVTRGEP